MNRAVYWFRNNLRLRDNPSLLRCVEECDEVIPVWVYQDRWAGTDNLGFEKMGGFRQKFMLEAVQDLREQLRALGSDLLVLRGRPVESVIDCCEKYGVNHVYASREHADYEIKQEARLSEQINLHLSSDQSLYIEGDLPFALDRLPRVFTDFRKKVEKYSEPRQQVEPVKSIPPLPSGFEASEDLQITRLTVDDRTAHPFLGGEHAAWERLQHYFDDSQALSIYKKTRNGLIGTMYSSKFSAYLSLGCISAVSIFDEIGRYEDKHGSNESTYWLFFELLWREFFRWVGLKHGSSIFRESGILNRQRDTKENMQSFHRWMHGETGDDFVDANMRELAATGFMSNRGRQNVASYLVHRLKQNWTWGAKYFESQLIDYDPTSNWCNWMYQSGVGNDPRDRVFNTQKQAKMYDEDGAYRRLWLES